MWRGLVPARLVRRTRVRYRPMPLQWNGRGFFCAQDTSDVDVTIPLTHDTFESTLARYPIGVGRARVASNDAGADAHPWGMPGLLRGNSHVGRKRLSTACAQGSQAPHVLHTPARPPARTPARSRRELLRTLVPLVPAAGAHVGGGHAGGAHAVPRGGWAHPLCKGGRPALPPLKQSL